MTFPKAGTYRLWVRTKNWVEKFSDPNAKAEAPGRFQVIVDGTAVGTEFGDQGADWHWLDVHHSDASKGGAIKTLKELLGLERVICFGDSDNDLSMFEQADEATHLRFGADVAHDKAVGATAKPAIGDQGHAVGVCCQ